MNLQTRTHFGEEIQGMTSVETPPTGDNPLLDYEIRVDD
jgi:hypothetical protein